MEPIRKGDRGPAVEDVQRRLIALGFELGPTGVDGVFLGATYAAVSAFQRDRGLDEDGEVGPLTWAALVDATFTLGDRLLYLRLPYLHGADIRTLQSALGALGFGCGEIDGIFGAFTERAVRDFQANSGLAQDGIAGPGTVRAIEALRHVWSSKSAPVPAELHAGPVRRAAVLRDREVRVLAEGPMSAVGRRIVNLARAAEAQARIGLTEASSIAGDAPAINATQPVGPSAPAGVLLLELVHDAPAVSDSVRFSASDAGFVRMLGTAVSGADGSATRRVVVVVPEVPADEYALQVLAVSVLDGLCLGLGAPGSLW